MKPGVSHKVFVFPKYTVSFFYCNFILRCLDRNIYIINLLT